MSLARDRSLADATATGPNAGTWRLPEDACGGVHGNCPGGCNALDQCTHDVTGMLPPAVTGAPINMRMTYVVTDVGGTGRKRVAFDVSWDQ